MPDLPQPPQDARPQPDSAQVASDLRRASDLLMQQIDRLHALESRKRELPPEDPEFVRLAREIRDVAAAALVETSRQEHLADQVAQRSKAGDTAVDHPIEDIAPGPREAVVMLAEWRAAERRLAAAPEGSDEARQARAEVERLRGEYARTIGLRSDEGLGDL